LPGVRAEVPIEIVFVGGLTERPIAYHPRNLILVEEGGAATVVEHHVGVGAGAYFANGVTEIRVAERGHLRHYIVQAESREAIHLATAHVEVARDATYEAFTLSTGSRLARNEASVRLTGEGAHCGLSGAYLMCGRQHCDNTILIEHVVPRTSCREVFKGVLDDQARAVFQGKIVVHREAQKTDGHQVSKALLLSDGAEIDMKPELEICADDVKCSHGAAAGELDHDALFYLRSRGVPEPLARGLLVEAFIEEAFEEMSCEDLRATLMANVSNWLALSQEEAA
jgi:Fe-S cluster assembly protein SufD